jgi:hypothetical protein
MADEIPWRPILRRKSSGGKPVRPFSPFSRVRAQHAAHLEVERCEAFSVSRREDVWLRRRRHAPLDIHIPGSWSLDALYLRHAEEWGYCERLHRLEVTAAVSQVSDALVCFDRPWVPYVWPAPPRVPELTAKTYPLTGDFPDPAGGAALDSPWCLRDASVRHGTGDPGRLLMEGRTEHRLATNTGFLVPFQQVEFFDQQQEARDAFYVHCPPWWEDAWISRNMAVPLPPVVTYKASQLLSRKNDTIEGRFWWLVFESEWTVLVFARWCADIRQRRLMWRLPARARDNITTMGVGRLLTDSEFNDEHVLQWLVAHDNYAWGAERRKYRVAGPNRENPTGVYQDVVEFVRQFDPLGLTLVSAGQAKSIEGSPESPYTPEMTTETDQETPSTPKTPMGARQTLSPSEEIVAAGVVPIRRSPSHQSQTMRIPVLRSAPLPVSHETPIRRQESSREVSNVTRTPSLVRARSATATQPAQAPSMAELRREGKGTTLGSSYEIYERSPAPRTVPIPASLRASLLQAGLGNVLQHYARVRQASQNLPVHGELLITEEVIVETIVQLDAVWRRTDAQRERSEAAEEQTAMEVAELRAELRKAAIMRDLLLERVSRLESEALPNDPYVRDPKRPRQ